MGGKIDDRASMDRRRRLCLKTSWIEGSKIVGIGLFGSETENCKRNRSEALSDSVVFTRIVGVDVASLGPMRSRCIEARW